MSVPTIQQLKKLAYMERALEESRRKFCDARIALNAAKRELDEAQKTFQDDFAAVCGARQVLDMSPSLVLLTVADQEKQKVKVEKKVSQASRLR